MRFIRLLALSLSFCSSAVAQTPMDRGGQNAVVLHLTLRTAVSSNDAKAGKEFRMELKQGVTLADGTVLPKGTVIHGSVIQAAHHHKDIKNGALLLVLDKALPKSGPPVNLSLQIIGLAPSAASAAMHNVIGGAKVGGTSNMGGPSQLDFDNNEHSEARAKFQSSLVGVYIQPTTVGSGMVFSRDEDIYLDEGIEIVAQVVPPHPDTLPAPVK